MIFNNMKLPDWVKLQTGFTFADDSGDPCIILGYAARRETKDCGEVSLWSPELKEKTHYNLAQLEFLPKSLLAVQCYKGEMSVIDLFHKDYDEAWWNCCSPLPDAAGKLLDLVGTVGEAKWQRNWIDHRVEPRITIVKKRE